MNAATNDAATNDAATNDATTASLESVHKGQRIISTVPGRWTDRRGVIEAVYPISFEIRWDDGGTRDGGFWGQGETTTVVNGTEWGKLVWAGLRAEPVHVEGAD